MEHQLPDDRPVYHPLLLEDDDEQVEVSLIRCPIIGFLFIRLALWVGIEYVWDTFPSTPFTSLLLLGLHSALLLGLLFSPAPPPYVARVKKTKNNKRK